MRYRAKLFAILALALGLIAPAGLRPESAAALSCGPCPATTKDDLNLRAEPSLSAEVLLVMPAGSAVEWDNFAGRDDGWVAVTYDGTSGWAYDEYLWLFPGFATTTDALNLRADPNLSAEVLEVMPAGAPVMLLGGPENGFFTVRYEERISGWASADYLDIDEGGSDPPPAGDEFATGSLVIVDTDALNLRAAPGLDGDVLTVLPTGAEGTVLEPPLPLDGYVWYRVNFGSDHGAGWVAGDFLGAAGEGGFVIGDQVRVNSFDGLNYRAEPSLDAAVITVWPDGKTGAITDGPVFADGYTWWQFSTAGYGPDGEAPGWVVGQYIELA